MSNKTGVGGNVPMLRFPEFRGAPEWDESTLKDVSDFVKNKIPLSDLTLETYVSTENLLADCCGFAIASKLPQLGAVTRFRQQDILISNIRPYLKKVWLALFDGGASNDVVIIRAKHGASSEFLALLLMNDEFISYVMKGAKGVKMPRGDVSLMRNYPLSVPSKAEQQKIAGCLSSIYDLITAQTQELDALKTHKDGLMQQLFPAEGETVPKLRFPEFHDAGDWKKHKVSRLLKKVSNPVSVDIDEMYRQIGIRSHGKGIFHKELVSGEALGNKRVFWVEDDAFVANIVFAWEQAVAKTSSAEKGMIASHRFPMYKAIPNRSDVHYILYFFLTKAGKDLLWLASPGGAGRNKTLGQKDFENCELCLPERVEEQTKIASCLSSIDDLITAQTKKIEALKAHKKGLMQQLFPSADEAYG